MKYLAVLLLTLGINVQAQTYVITNPQGYVTGTVQIQGNQAQECCNERIRISR